MKVSIGLIFSHGFPVPAPFVVGLTDMLRVLLTGEGNRLLPEGHGITSARVLISHAFPIDAARNELCRMFLDEDNGDYLLFLDADMKHPADLAHRLVAHGQAVVSGRYQMRRPPFLTVAMRKTGPGRHDYQAVDKVASVAGLLPIDAAGAGALLIGRKALEAIRARVGDNWFQYQVGQKGLRDVSEDMWFFEQARACGFQPYLDADAVCAHVAQFEIDAEWLKPYQAAFEARQAVNA